MGPKKQRLTRLIEQLNSMIQEKPDREKQIKFSTDVNALNIKSEAVAASEGAFYRSVQAGRSPLKSAGIPVY